MRRSLLPVALALALLGAGCGSSRKPATTAHATTIAPTTRSTSSTTKPAPPKVQLSTTTVPGLGQVLVNGQGKTLYVFAPDKAKRVTCVSQCAAIWPPLTLSGGAEVVASGGVKASLLGSAPNPGGGRVVTYAGWPLYAYVADTGAGSARGQAVDLNGGRWYVISPAGTVIAHKASSSATY
jgi:predicted lipoprotein with Yx(FWY)xxD motif